MENKTVEIVRAVAVEISVEARRREVSKIAEPYKCDSCGKSRDTDANHWWIMFIRNVTVLGEGRPYLVVNKWHKTLAVNVKGVHACGEDCASKLIQRWMQTGSFESPSQRPISKAVSE